MKNRSSPSERQQGSNNYCKLSGDDCNSNARSGDYGLDNESNNQLIHHLASLVVVSGERKFKHSHQDVFRAVAAGTSMLQEGERDYSTVQDHSDAHSQHTPLSCAHMFSNLFKNCSIQ